LRHPDWSRRFVLRTDACGHGIGAVLEQDFDDGMHPVGFISRTLQEAERKWHIREQEALAVVWAVVKFRHYLEGHEFLVETDHESLQWLMDQETPGRLASWVLRLQEFLPNMKIKYLPEKDNPVADFLSRVPLEALERLQTEMDKAKTLLAAVQIFQEVNSAAGAMNLARDESTILLTSIAEEELADTEAENLKDLVYRTPNFRDQVRACAGARR
jgi:hypothetical protein